MKRFKKLFFYIPVLCAGLWAISCSSDNLPTADEPQEPTATVQTTGKLTFRLGGAAAGRSTTERAIQTDAERTIHRLVAVFFNGNVEQTGTVQPQDNETFIECKEILNPTDGQEYTIELSSQTKYTMCLVANPDATLLQAIQNLTTASTLDNFKGLTTTADPDENSKLMTSDFYSIYLPQNGSASLGTVDLTRAMARVDIVNLANGVTITKVTFKNRAKQTRLKVDSPESWTSTGEVLHDMDYLMTLVGNDATDATGNTYAAKIYSYENLTGGTATTAPKLEIVYTKEGTSYTHTVEFKQHDSNGTEHELPVKRNTYYRILVSEKSGSGLRFYVAVADWDSENVKIPVSSDDLAGGIIAPGDFLMSNGMIMSKKATLTASQQSQVVGIVFYLTENLDDPKLGDGVKAKLTGSTLSQHGLAIALKNATSTEPVQWKTTNTPDEALPDYDYLNEAYIDYDGYKHCQWGFTQNLTNYPTFRVGKEYRDNPPVNFSSTGWYVPSMGELMLMMEEVSGKKFDLEENAFQKIDESEISCPAIATLNTSLVKAGGEKLPDKLWTSSEHYPSMMSGEASWALNYDYDTEGTLQNADYIFSNKTNVKHVRCILAF